jgi:hypothetical protein
MSATNRGTLRAASDFYPTPLGAFEPLICYLPNGGLIWEPACGDRRLIVAMTQRGLQADGDDILNGYDFLADNSKRFANVTNPPFSKALAFAQHSVAHAEHTFLLLRLNFLGSLKRKAWFCQHEPDALFILSKRPSFVNGGTDATDYAWFAWSPLWKGIRHL